MARALHTEAEVPSWHCQHKGSKAITYTLKPSARCTPFILPCVKALNLQADMQSQHAQLSSWLRWRWSEPRQLNKSSLPQF